MPSFALALLLSRGLKSITSMMCPFLRNMNVYIQFIPVGELAAQAWTKELYFALIQLDGVRPCLRQ